MADLVKLSILTCISAKAPQDHIKKLVPDVRLNPPQTLGGARHDHAISGRDDGRLAEPEIKEIRRCA
jgi:hypothetical protein